LSSGRVDTEILQTGLRSPRIAAEPTSNRPCRALLPNQQPHEAVKSLADRKADTLN
jgi:hypothetical protein